MIASSGGDGTRALEEILCDADLLVAGGGLAGLCCAITAAREGVRVLLVQDRPVLGGNGSSEVRLWILGATSHMGNNNRWAREGGVIDEILVENLWRNREGNPIILDALLLEKAVLEPNLQLLLNTAIDSVEIEADGSIRSARAYCSQNQRCYKLSATLFCDASGDGILGFLSGAAFRMGAESTAEFGEGFAPPTEYGELLGHSLYFYTRDTGRPVRYIAPAFALRNIEEIPRYRELKATSSGCSLWWLEYGGRLDTVHQTEEIKWELWKVAYGVWNYIKNSGEFPEAENLTIEWMGMIPGKRESRRFEGDYMLRQQDIVRQTQHDDAVSFGGWAMDLHPADGVYSDQSGCTQWHAKGVYQIPYRTMYSRNVPNLFLTGRLISASHVAFGSTRVMATCAHNGQAVGMAAALCIANRVPPRALGEPGNMRRLQTKLLRAGQHIPGFRLQENQDLAPNARISASSIMRLDALTPDGGRLALNQGRALLFPVQRGSIPRITLLADVAVRTELLFELWVSGKLENYTPDVLLQAIRVPAEPGLEQPFNVNFDVPIDEDRYVFLVLPANPAVSLCTSSQRVTGLLTLSQRLNPAVAKGAIQNPPPEIGIDSFAFWLPQRRPGDKNLAVKFDPPLDLAQPSNVANGFGRPYLGTNAWIAAFDDEHPSLTLEWETPQRIRRIELGFDTDFDHPMESVLMGHPEPSAPFCICRYRVLNDLGRSLYEAADNHTTRNHILIEPAIATTAITVEVLETRGAPAAIFSVRCYDE